MANKTKTKQSAHKKGKHYRNVKAFSAHPIFTTWRALFRCQFSGCKALATS